jgi:AAHS family 4-hydroxybenzoate transporter-like MFS transporter
MFALAAHVYPTPVRATGVGSASAVGRSGALLSSFVGAWAIETGGSHTFFLLMACAMAATFVFLAFLTRHTPRLV